MASLRKESDRGRVGWRLQFRCEGKRRSLWLSDPSKRRAETVMRHVDELVLAKSSGGKIDAGTKLWVESLTGKLFQSLVRCGLVEARSDSATDEAQKELKGFCDAYIKSRTDVAQSTRDNYGHARRLLVERFGEKHPIEAITEGDAERWRRWLLSRPVAWDEDKKPTKTMAVATVSKHVKRAKTMFDEAVKDRLLDSNPFKNLKTGSEANRDRDHFITREAAAAVLRGCPDEQWRLIFALARFGGLRRCEILVMNWADVLWDENKLRIDSPKTGVRHCPIFPELMPMLRESFEEAPEGTARLAYRYRRAANLGTQMNRIIERAGVPIWAKTFQNLRSTRRTELQEKFQDHVVNSWMGHGSETAAKHYLQVTADHFAAGSTALTGEPIDTATSGGVTGGVISANLQASGAIETQKNPVKQAVDCSGSLGIVSIATPLGLEPRMAGPKPAVLPITPRGSGCD